MKKLQVPYNLDKEIIEIYKNYQEYISEIYFAAPPSVFPTARQFEIEEEEYIKDCCELCKNAIIKWNKCYIRYKLFCSII